MAGRSLAEDGWSQQPTAWSVIVRAPINHRAARTRHPDAVAVEAAVQVAAALVLLVEGVEVGQEFATLSAHAARLGALPATRATQETYKLTTVLLKSMSLGSRPRSRTFSST